jgi:DNA processing protein
MLMTPARPMRGHAGGTYTAPPHVETVWLHELLQSSKRGGDPRNIPLFYAGDLSLTALPSVSIVGTREATSEGRSRATRLARELIAGGVVVVSGLARGIDTAAHTSAVANGGRTIAVIGTPIARASPVENGPLQETIWRNHLLISPFQDGRPVYPKNFPERNRVMAALSDATVIVEASDTSGTLHQASECQQLGRWLFILRTAAENPSVSWPKRFLNGKNTAVLDKTEQIFDALGR